MKKIITGTILSVLFSVNAKAQGCSDAGFCTIRSVKNNTKTAGAGENKNELAVNFSFGKGERSTSYYTTEIEYTKVLSKSTSVTGKLGYSFIDGELATTNGLTDLFLSVSHLFDGKQEWRKSFVAGIKIPLSDAGKVQYGIQLPMPYQTSLGTTDLVLGYSIAKKSFGATIALQQPLTSKNKNRFLPEDYPAVRNADKYLPTNQFSRKGDALLRLSYNFDLNKKFSIRPSLLFIYHLANDTYTDVSKPGVQIMQSAGLTANINVFASYILKNGNGLELSLGTPFVVRTKRPDGLTRSVVASLQYKISF